MLSAVDMETIDHEPTVRPRSVGRPSTVEPYSRRISAWLLHEPSLSGAEVLRRVQREGYAGGKSALYELIRRLRAGQEPR